MGLIAVLVMPSIVDSLNKSKETSYKVLINNIKTAAETFYEECEYGDLSDQTKYGTDACKINSTTNKSYIETTIGDLASTGFLKVSSDKEDKKEKVLNDLKIINNQLSSYIPLMREYEDEILRLENTCEHLRNGLASGGDTEKNYKIELEQIEEHLSTSSEEIAALLSKGGSLEND